jgi:hypothetical protein
LKREVIAVIAFGLCIGLLASVMPWQVFSPLYPRRDFNILLKYGVGAKNELNTFDSTYTKDMIAWVPITIRLYLSDAELKQIRQQVTDMNLFSYPESFPPNTGGVAPQSDYYLKIQDGKKTKEISWNINSQIDADMQNSLQSLVRNVTDMVYGKWQYKILPPPIGGYC